jgi:hypothetical protein
MKTGACICCIITAALFLASTGLAQTDREGFTGACNADIEKFCTTRMSGSSGSRVMACLKANEGQLSEACKKYLAQDREKRERVQEFGKTCKEDTEKFCKDIRPGQGRIVACLKSHEAELADACRAFFKK